MKYAHIRECSSFWTWLLCFWDFQVGWETPYVQIREVGMRIFGLEMVHFEARDAHDRLIYQMSEWRPDED